MSVYMIQISIVILLKSRKESFREIKRFRLKKLKYQCCAFTDTKYKVDYVFAG